MGLSVECPHCKKRLRIRDESAGRKLTCPSCSQVLSCTSEPATGDSAAVSLDAQHEKSPQHSARGQSVATTAITSAWKVPAGFAVLFLGTGLLMIPMYVLFWSIVQSPFGPPKEPSIILVGAASAVCVLLGCPFTRMGTIGKVFNMIATGILIGFVIVKGWEAVAEGSEEPE